MIILISGASHTGKTFIIEKRFDDTWFTKETALEENIKNLELCKQNNCCYILIDDRYDVDIEINRPETFSVVP